MNEYTIRAEASFNALMKSVMNLHVENANLVAENAVLRAQIEELKPPQGEADGIVTAA